MNTEMEVLAALERFARDHGINPAQVPDWLVKDHGQRNMSKVIPAVINDHISSFLPMRDTLRMLNTCKTYSPIIPFIWRRYGMQIWPKSMEFMETAPQSQIKEGIAARVLNTILDSAFTNTGSMMVQITAMEEASLAMGLRLIPKNLGVYTSKIEDMKRLEHFRWMCENGFFFKVKKIDPQFTPSSRIDWSQLQNNPAYSSVGRDQRELCDNLIRCFTNCPTERI